MASSAPKPGDKENGPPSPAFGTGKKRSAGSAGLFTRGPVTKQARIDPLVGVGRHFGRTIRTFCRVQTLIRNGLTRSLQLDLGRVTEEELSPSEMSEHHVFQQLLKLSSTLEERLVTGTEQELYYIADMITKGASSSRSDDTRSLKSAVVDWITPTGGFLSPPLIRNVKDNRGFHHPRTGELLCPVNLDWNDEKIRRDLTSGELKPSGDLWPRFLYRAYEYDDDNPWKGLFRSGLLVKAFKHVFTSPSSVLGDSANRATRTCNAKLHGMENVTVGSIAYIATQVRFALSSAPTFSRTDAITDSEYFYNLVVELLEDPEECEEVEDLLKWWNMQIFPSLATHGRPLRKESVFARIKDRRRQMRLQQESQPSGSETAPGQPTTAAAPSHGS